MVAAETSNATLRIFFSYALADKARAQPLRRLLSQQAQVRIFSTDELSAGDDVLSHLREEIVGCDLFVVLLSPEALNSSWVLHELGAAWGLEKPIVAVMTQPQVSVPVDLSKASIVRLTSLESAEEVDQLLAPYQRLR